MRILVVEDNRCFGRLIADHLTGAGYAVDLADSVRDFRDFQKSVAYDIFLIDLNLPDGDGMCLVRGLRKRNCAAPILIMTARSTVQDRIAGLDFGGDDYLVKPFNHLELQARIRALLRRPPVLQPNTVKSGDLVVDTVFGEATWQGNRIDLRPSEQRLFNLLIRQAGHIVTRSAIENVLPGFGCDRSANAVDKLVSRLREALKLAGAEIKLNTVKGVGYIIEELP